MKRLSIRESFTFEQMLHLTILDPMREFLHSKGYELQFSPGEFTMSEDELQQVGLFPEALAGACKCIHFADGWAFDDLCASVEEILLVLWTITFRDYLDFLSGKFNPFESKESFFLLCELGTKPEAAPVVKRVPIELDYESTMLLNRLKWFPDPRSALPLAGRINKDTAKRIESVSRQFHAKYLSLKKEMQDSRDAGYDGDDHWYAIHLKEQKLLYHWQEALEFLV